MSRTNPSKLIVTQARDVKRKPGDLERLRARSKQPIDASDPPPITQADLDSGKARIVRRTAPARKVSLTIRLDEDVVAWFKQQGEGYQTRINEALREYRAAVDQGDPQTTAAAIDRIEALLAMVRRKVS